jgi:hypothetical protein
MVIAEAAISRLYLSVPVFAAVRAGGRFVAPLCASGYNHLSLKVVDL